MVPLLAMKQNRMHSTAANDLRSMDERGREREPARDDEDQLTLLDGVGVRLVITVHQARQRGCSKRRQTDPAQRALHHRR